jgi:hypothetical protein
MRVKLQLWNGGDSRGGSYYVCATTKKNLIELLHRAGYKLMTMRELNMYWSPTWGNAMNGITPEIGVWFQRSHDEKPRKII